MTELGDHQAALEVLEQAWQVPGLEARGRTRAGLLLQKMGRLERALPLFEEAARHAHQAQDALELAWASAGRAEILVALDRVDEAEQTLVHALRTLDDDKARYWLFAALGEVLRQAGDAERACKAYLRAHEYLYVPGARPVLLTNLALAQLDTGRVHEALQSVDLAWQLLMPSDGLMAATVGCIRLAAQAACGQLEAVRAGLPARLAEAARHKLAEADVGTALERAATEVWKLGGQVEAVRLVVGAIAVWERLGRHARVRSGRDALRAMADDGAPVPIGGWVLDQQLGQGGTGVVWRAEGPDGPVALKILQRGGQALQQEVRAAATLDHPHITALIDLVHAGPAAQAMLGLRRDQDVLVMELASEGSLAARAGWLAWDPLRDVLDQLLQALAHAHACGLVHLDIKPENVLMHRGQVRLADFGLARAFGSTQKICGTPAFMAPEMVRRRAVGPSADLYSVGCLAWCLAAGRLPFEGTLDQVLTAQARDPLPPLQPVQDMPSGLEAWIGRLTRKRPEERFRSAAVARDALLALTGAPTGATSRNPCAVKDQVTWCWDLDVPELPPEPPPQPIQDPPRPVPPTWRLPRRNNRTMGPGLFRWRRWPLVGRDAALDRLWEELRLSQVTPRKVALLGAPGSGRRHLRRELEERAREVDASLDGLTFVQDDEADRYIELAPVSHDDARVLLRSLVALRADLEQQVLEVTDGDPGFVVELLSVWVEQGWLDQTPDGFVLRPGRSAATVPPSLEEQALARLPEAEDARATADLLAVMGACSARELGAACRAADRPPPRGFLKTLTQQGLLRQDGDRLHLLPVLRQSLLQALPADAALRLHGLAADATTDPAQSARHLLWAEREEEAAPALAALALERRDPALARDALKALDGLFVPPDDPRRAPLVELAG